MASSSISPSTQRKSDIKLLAIITTGVLMMGFFVAGTILFLTTLGGVGGAALYGVFRPKATAPAGAGAAAGSGTTAGSGPGAVTG